MACEYTKVLKSIGCEFIVIGRGKESANAFQKQTGIIPVTGGADKFLANSNYSDWKAIVAVTVDQLRKVTLTSIKHGIKSILVEKPGGLDNQEIKSVKEAAEKFSAQVYVAYNRRFYASVKKAQEIIKNDGGVLSYHFEFNELADIIASLNHSLEIKQGWLLNNSSHVIDLAFFLGGIPKTLTANITGSLSWHPKGAIFTGCGVAKQSIPFTYHSNWLAPGRWGLEIMTKNHRLILRPLEKLKAQKKGSFDNLDVELDDKLDIDFKPGLFNEVESFIKTSGLLCTIEEQFNHLYWYDKILNGR